MTNATNTTPSARVYACPGCKASIVWDSKNPFRPFCSEKCKNHDFIGWANEEHAIAGDPLMDEMFSGDMERE